MENEGPVDFLQLNRSIWGVTGDRSLFDRIMVFFTGRSLPEIMADNRVRGFETPGAFISQIIPVLIAAGFLILFVMIVWGAFEIMLGASDPKSAEAGKKRITAAVIGFLLLFGSYWIGQLLQLIFGINIGLL